MGKIAPAAFYASLKQRNMTDFYGVPDSLLKDLCAYITENSPAHQHVITANEGNAVGMATGYHLATGKVPVVYLQNSGFGNTLNPLLSMTHSEVYQIPMLMLIGWRGDPGKKDEPQHVAQGRLMPECLKAAEMPFEVLEACDNIEGRVETILSAAQAHFEKNKTPFGVLIKRDTFDSFKMTKKADGDKALQNLEMSREQALELILRTLNDDDIVVGTTGMPSREIFEIRSKAKSGHHRDFLTVGAMGHSSSIAAGIALQKPERNVFSLDGDGAAIMHLGSFAVNGGLGAIYPVAGGERTAENAKPLLSNLKHIVVNNGAHDSVGGQPTVGFDVSLTEIAKACGYKIIRSEPVITAGDAVAAVAALRDATGPAFLEILVKKGNRKDIGRPTTTPLQNKQAFEAFVQGKESSKL
jgi:phosphonopyruvate decarboxylase